MSTQLVISVVDDDEPMRAALVALLRSLGYRAQGFASAEEFLGSGPAQALACIITDVHMLGMSGIELQQRLAASGDRVPVIVITARAEPDLEARALASGAASFLRKPFAAKALIGSLKRALRH